MEKSEGIKSEFKDRAEQAEFSAGVENENRTADGKLKERPGGAAARYALRIRAWGYTNRTDRRKKKKEKERPRLRILINEIVDPASLGLDSAVYDLEQSADRYAYIKRTLFLSQIRYLFRHTGTDVALSVAVNAYDRPPAGRTVSVFNVKTGELEPADADRIECDLSEISACVFGHCETWARLRTSDDETQVEG